VRLGERPDDLAYERGAVKRCESVGIRCEVLKFGEGIPREALAAEIVKTGDRRDVHGILVFRPLPEQIGEGGIRHLIPPDKDVDCFSPEERGKGIRRRCSGFAPCTLMR
jgi:methylenetetrahydrofolate dehydrogenase (NADP+)/methenyltetrahydrofolate cyclohydrolase